MKISVQSSKPSLPDITMTFTAEEALFILGVIRRVGCDPSLKGFSHVKNFYTLVQNYYKMTEVYHDSTSLKSIQRIDDCFTGSVNVKKDVL